MVVLVTCKNKEDPIKNEGARVVTRVPHYNPMGAICCHGNQSSDPIRPKTLCSQSPTPMMLQMKFDYDQKAGLRDIHVESVDAQTHAGTDARTRARVPYYKLTLSLRLW